MGFAQGFFSSLFFALPAFLLPFPAQGAFPPLPEGDPSLFERSPLQLFNQILPETFGEKQYQRALKLLADKHLKIKAYLEALEKLYSLKPSQIARLLNESQYFLQSEKTEPVSNAEAQALYDEPKAEKIISFIEKHRLSEKHILFALIPLFRNQSAPEDILKIIEETNLSPKASLQAKDMIVLWLSSPGPLYIDPEMRLFSLGQAIASSQSPKLIKWLFSREDFDPGLANELGQTPLHSLFDKAGFPKTAGEKALSKKDWGEILSAIKNHPETDFNAKDTQGISPLAAASANGFIEAVKLLAEISAVDLSAKDLYGRTAVITASRSKEPEKKEIVRFLISKGGAKLAAPSFLNEFLTENLDPIQIDHPLKPALSQSFAILSEKKEKGFNRYEESILKLYEYEERLETSRQARRQIIENMGKKPAPYYEAPALKAIEEDNADFFKKNYNKDIQSFSEAVFLSIPLPYIRKGPFDASQWTKSSLIKSYHLLLRAISMNSPEVVEFFLERLSNMDIFQPGKEAGEGQRGFAYMDPLSEALLVSAGINSERYSEDKSAEKKKILKIIRLLLDHQNIDLSFTNFMDLKPVEVAILTGHLPAVKEMRKRQAALPEDSLWDTGVEHLELAQRLGFARMSVYLEEQKNLPAGSSCQAVFH